MSGQTFTCPRCFHVIAVRQGLRFCPHCRLEGAQESAGDQSPLHITVGKTQYAIGERLAVGSVCTLYRCSFWSGGKSILGVCKIARDERANPLVGNEADMLRRLHGAVDAAQYAPFLPVVEATFAVGGTASELSRQALIMRLHEGIGSPDALYTLFEVKSRYPGGLDGRDVAWIWRRLLNVLGFVHARSTVHGAVLPMHVLIEPNGHKLVLVDWCCARRTDAGSAAPLTIIAGGFRAWYKREQASTCPPVPALDVAMGSRCMIDLLGGDAVRGEFPPGVDPALRRHFTRLLVGGAGSHCDAWKVLEDFDRLIEALWGPREFRPLPMPPKSWHVSSSP